MATHNDSIVCGTRISKQPGIRCCAVFYSDRDLQESCCNQHTGRLVITLCKQICKTSKEIFLGRVFFLVIVAIALPLATSQSVYAQHGDARLEEIPTAEFHFARLVYRNAPGSRRSLRGWGQAWQTDYADAEYHLMQGINRMIRIDGQTVEYNGDGGRLITLDNGRLFDYPWLYAVEVGQWYLNDSEAALLREYLDRGGFLLVDDFWGASEWSLFMASMRRVFPDRTIIDLPDDHEIMHTHFDIRERTQIPGRNGSRPGTRPQWRAIVDDNERVVVAINFNMDMGDAWEHADDPTYPAEMTGLAYRFAMNYVVYSMTH